MKPEEFSNLGMYGSREFFERKQQEGYSEVASGVGDWVGVERIVVIWAFYHPKKRFRSITTLQHPKFDDGCHTIRGSPYEKKYTPAGFDRFTRRMKIKIGSRQNLAELLQNWDK
jgi:hypothetical protein